jgi:flagellar motor switch protein FliG
MDINKRRAAAYESARRKTGRAEDSPPDDSEAAITEQAERLIKTGPEGTGYEKAAKLLLLLGQDEAANVLRHMKSGEVDRLSKEIVRIEHISAKEARDILEEFGSLARSRGIESAGGMAAAESMLKNAFGEDKGQAILRNAVRAKAAKPFSFLGEIDPAQVILILREEPVSVAAIILSYLDPKQASAVIRLMSPEKQHEVIKRIASLQAIDPEVLKKMEAALHEKISLQGKMETEAVDGTAALASILRYLEPERGQSIIAELDEIDPEIGRQIRDKLFTLDDVMEIGDRQLQEALREYSPRELAVLLKGKEDPFRNKILANVSANRRSLVLEEYDYLGPIKRDEADDMTRRFLARFKILHETGKLIIHGDEDLVE